MQTCNLVVMNPGLKACSVPSSGRGFRQVLKVVVLKKFQLHATGRNMCGSDSRGHLHLEVFCRNMIERKLENRADCIKTGVP